MQATLPSPSRVTSASKPLSPTGANHPVLVIWRSRNGDPSPKLSEALKAWLDNATGSGGRDAKVQDIAMPYHHGRAAEAYHFSYAWVYPADRDTAPAN